MQLRLFLAVLVALTAGAQQPVDSPAISMGIVVDTSGSMTYRLSVARQLIAELLKSAGPSDEFALIRAADRPVAVSGFVSAAEAKDQLAWIQAKGSSALLDGIYLGSQLVKAGRNRHKVLLVISDGDDNRSRYTVSEVRNAIPEAGIRLYVAGIGESAEHAALSMVGGRHLALDAQSNLSQAAGALRAAMRAQ